jgi:hypothetical protein
MSRGGGDLRRMPGGDGEGLEPRREKCFLSMSSRCRRGRVDVEPWNLIEADATTKWASRRYGVADVV